MSVRCKSELAAHPQHALVVAQYVALDDRKAEEPRPLDQSAQEQEPDPAVLRVAPHRNCEFGIGVVAGEPTDAEKLIPVDRQRGERDILRRIGISKAARKGRSELTNRREETSPHILGGHVSEKILQMLLVAGMYRTEADVGSVAQCEELNGGGNVLFHGDYAY